MTDFNSQMDAVLAQNGVSVEKDFAMVNLNALVFLLQASKSGFAKAVLPEGMALISSEQDVDSAVTRIVSDEAFSVANLRAMAKFVEAKFEGKDYDASEIAQFYELYKNSSDEDKITAQIGTYRLLDELMNAEVNRVGTRNGEVATSKEFDAMVEGLEPDDIRAVQRSIQPVAEFAFNIGQIIMKAEQQGKSVVEARDANRTVGFINTMILSQQIDEVGGLIVQYTFKNLLPKDQFEMVEALGQREVDRQKTGDASVNH